MKSALTPPKLQPQSVAVEVVGWEHRAELENARKPRGLESFVSKIYHFVEDAWSNSQQMKGFRALVS